MKNTIDRRDFIKSCAAASAVFSAPNILRAAAPKEPLIWANLLQLGCNMWNDHEADKFKEFASNGTADYLRFDEGVWRNLTERMHDIGMNMIIIDLAEGLVYPMFSPSKHIAEPPAPCERYVISCDYGTMNPTSFGLWGLSEGCWYRFAESYYDARKAGVPKTDEEHYLALEALAKDYPIEQIVIDPSAASFIACIRKHGRYVVVPAKNDVLAGIHRVADAIRAEKIRIGAACQDALREFSLYAWDAHAGSDAPVKEHDHAMDDIRYFVSTVLDSEERTGFYVTSLSRTDAAN